MSELTRILTSRGVRGGYKPFTQPRYRGSYNLPAPRGNPYTTNALLYSLATSKLTALRGPSPRSTLSLYEDRRLWHPLGKHAFPKSKTEAYPSFVTTPTQSIWAPSGRPHVVPPLPNWSPIRRIKGDDVDTSTGQIVRFGAYNPFKVSWENPYKMIVCLKRKMRREIMNAMGYAGKTGFKSPRFNQYSYVRCF